jgi:hypothetical protein
MEAAPTKTELVNEIKAQLKHIRLHSERIFYSKVPEFQEKLRSIAAECKSKDVNAWTNSELQDMTKRLKEFGEWIEYNSTKAELMRITEQMQSIFTTSSNTKNPWLAFCKEHRHRIKQENPHMKTKDIIAQLSLEYAQAKLKEVE